MLEYLFKSLGSFRKVFSRHQTWILFVVFVLGFIGTSELIGVSSFCRFWLVDQNSYYSFLRFFRSGAWSLSPLLEHWWFFVLAQNETIFLDDRVILLGDHTNVSKDGHRMPGVVTIHQDSETQSKPSYYRGQVWGALGLLVGSMASPFCLPLMLKIHLGLNQLAEEVTNEKKRTTMGQHMVQMAIDFSLKTNQGSILVLGAFFGAACVFNLADSVWSLTLKASLVHIIVRAKKNYVAYFPAKAPKKKRRGRPKKYGEKVPLMEVFDHPHLFSKVVCCVYNRMEEISIAHYDLLWKPTGKSIRFVFALTSRGPIILMCSDLKQNPVLAIKLYCARIRIEVMFDVLKNLLGAFRFRFWSKKMPKNSRKPKKNHTIKTPSTENIPKVQLCWDAYEGFVALAAIAQGLLQLIALKFQDTIWRKNHYFLRTKSREMPSEKTVKQLIAPLLIFNFLNLSVHGTMREIRYYFFGENRIPQTQIDEQDDKQRAA